MNRVKSFVAKGEIAYSPFQQCLQKSSVQQICKNKSVSDKGLILLQNQH